MLYYNSHHVTFTIRTNDDEARECPYVPKSEGSVSNTGR